MDRTTPPRLLLLTTVAVTGLNLRPFLTGIGPLAASVHEATGLSLQGVALLTLVPMLLSMAVALDHLPEPAHAGAPSALMQGGFLIAAIPPWIVALLQRAMNAPLSALDRGDRSQESPR